MQQATSKPASRWIVSRLGLFAIPICVGLVAFAWSRWPVLVGPAVEAPETIELGLHANNTFLDTDVTIHNTGYRPLELSQFRVSCASCLSVGLRSESGATEISDLSVPPGESVTLSARILIHVSPERPFLVALTFNSNDPRRPEVTITFNATIRGQIYASPAEVDVGTLLPGQTVQKTVELRDSGRGSRCSLSRARSPAPDIVHLKLLPAPPESEALRGERRTSETLRILEIVVKAPTKPWSLDDRIDVYEEGREEPLVRIPIRGRVLAAVQVTPSSVVLPRVAAGVDSFTAECEFSSTTGKKILDVQPLDVPPDITLAPLDRGPDKAGRASYRIEWRADRRPAKGESRVVTARFRVSTETGTETVDVPVRCRSTD